MFRCLAAVDCRPIIYNNGSQALSAVITNYRAVRGDVLKRGEQGPARPWNKGIVSIWYEVRFVEAI
jgi:hypothetical protein